MRIPLLLTLGLAACGTFIGSADGQTDSPKFCYTCSRKIICSENAVVPCSRARPCNKWQQSYCHSGKQCTAIGKLSIPGAENKYIDCHYSKTWKAIVGVERNCPLGTIFSDDAQKCLRHEKFHVLHHSNRSEHNLPFLCPSQGMFADPFTCRKYHYCVEENTAGVTHECPQGTFFDEIQGYCLTTLTSECLQKIIDFSNSDHAASNWVIPSEITDSPSHFEEIKTNQSNPHETKSIGKGEEESLFSDQQVAYRRRAGDGEPSQSGMSALRSYNTDNDQSCTLPGRYPYANDCHLYWSCELKSLIPYNVEATLVSCGKKWYSITRFTCVNWRPVHCYI